MSISFQISLSYFVTPAKAGIHHPLLKFRVPVMAPRLRGGDEVWDIEVPTA